MNNPLESLFGGAIPNFGQNNEDEEEPPTEEIKTKRSEIKRQLEEGKLEKEKVRIKVDKSWCFRYARYKSKSANARDDESINA